MKKPKITYTVEEINDLLLSIQDTDTSFDGLPEVKEAISNFVLNSVLSEGRTFEVYQDIAAEAYSLELQAKELRSIVKAFKCPLKEAPTSMNHDNKIIAHIAKWRMKLGR